MRRVALFPGGPELSVLGFGAWKAGGSWIYGLGKVDDQTSMATIRRALEGGVNWIDTASIYGAGHSEEVVGQVLKNFPHVLVNTKCGHFPSPDGKSTYVDLSPAAIRRDCELSLRRLGRECIDIYQFHIPSDSSMQDGWQTMLDLQVEGKVRWIGSCNTDVTALKTFPGLNLTEGVYNLLHRGLDQSVLPWARKQQVGVLVYEAQVTGLLSGFFSAERLASLPPDDYRHRAVDFQPKVLKRALGLVEKLRPLAADLHLSVSELAIAYACSAPGVTGVMVGASTPVQVEGWLGAGSAELAPSVREQLTALAADCGFSPQADEDYAHVLKTIGSQRD